MALSRNVILDLLPVYMAGECSEDSRVLVEEYLKSDKELAQMVAESNKTPFAGNIAVPINKESEAESFRRTQGMIIRLILLGAGVFLVVGVTLLLTIAGIVYVMFMR